MLMMRLQRVGRKNDPSYRLIVTDKRESVASGRNIDHLGSYNPKLGTIEIDAEKAKHWLSKGAQPSVTVHNMLVSKKIIDAKKKNPLGRRTPIVNEEVLKNAEVAKAEETSTEAPKEEATV